MRPLGIRRRLLLLVVAAVAVALAALVAAFNIVLAHTLDGNVDDVLRADVAAQLDNLTIRHGTIVAREEPAAAAVDSWVWVLSGTRLLERPPVASSSVDAAAVQLGRGKARFVDVPGAEVRLHAVPVAVGGNRIGSIVVARSLEPYEQTRHTALVASLALGAIVLALVGLAARWLLASSLRPVARMTRQAADWSEHELDRRFALGEPYDELTELAATLDGLLERLAASLRREQRFSAELSHELRTPLTRVITETELALRREREPEEYRRVLELAHRNARQLARIVDTLVAAARYEAGSPRGTADAYDVVAEAASACAGLSSERGVVLTIDPPLHPIRVGVDPDLAERILQPVLENACRYGASTVRVSIDRSGNALRYDVCDDGSGVREAERERIFEPGVRGEAANGDGSGLGLALARRLAHTVGGEIEAIPDVRGGRFVVRLPAG
jgi:two-component system OmpR family sensor kinase